MKSLKNYSAIASTARVFPSAELSHPVNIGAHAEIHANTFIDQFSFINNFSVIYSHTSIGKYCSIGRNCEINVAEHPTHFLSTHSFQFKSNLFSNYPEYRLINKKKWIGHKNTVIGNDVWIGAKSIISSGVTIGDGAIIAGGAVVTKDIPPYTIVGGIPAKVIRKRFTDEVINELLSLAWWDLPIEKLKNITFDNINMAISEIKKIKNQ